MPDTEIQLLEKKKSLLKQLLQQQEGEVPSLGPASVFGQSQSPLLPPSGGLDPSSPLRLGQRDIPPFRLAGEPQPELLKNLGRFIFEAPNGANLIDDPNGYLVGMTVLAPDLEESAKRVAGGVVSGVTFGQVTPFADEELESGESRKETGSFKTGAALGTFAPIVALAKGAAFGIGALSKIKGLSFLQSSLVRQTIEASLVGSAYTGIEGAASGEGVKGDEVLITGGILGSVPIVGSQAVKLLRFMPQRVQKFIAGLFGSPTPKPARKILLERKKEILLGKIESDAIRKQITETIPPEHRAEALRILDPTAIGPPTGIKFSKDQLNVLRVAREKLDELGQAYVDAGLISKETFEKNVGTYLGRFYEDTEGNKTAFRALKDFFIRGDRARVRTLMTIEDRMKKGLVMDPSYSVSKSIENVTYDIATAKAFQKISQNTDFTSAIKKSGWKAIPNEEKFGDLAGKWVDPLIFDEISVLMNTRGEIGKIYDKLLGMWKFGKTAANPATHGRNIFSNTILADLGGLSPLRIDVYAKAAKGYIDKNKLYQEALEEGLFGTDWYGAEIKQFIGFVENGSGSMFSRGWDVAGKFSGATIGKLGELYQAEEHFFKFALYSYRRSKGFTATQAATHAKKYLFDYSDVSPLLARIRRAPLGGPFVTFTAKALPVIAETAINNPFAVGKYVIGAKGITAYSKTKLGMSDAEYALMMETLPPYQRGGWQVLVPFTDKQNNPVLFDLTYNLPWGDIGEQGVFSDEILDFVGVKEGNIGRKLAEPVLSIAEKFAGSNPVGRVPASILFNREPFTGREIVSETDRSLGLTGTKMRDFATRQISPSLIQNLQNVISAAKGERLPSGEKKDLMLSIGQYLLGLKFRPVLLDRNQQIRQRQEFKKLDNLNKRRWKVALDQSLSDDEKNKQMDAILSADSLILENLGKLYIDTSEEE